MNYVFPVALIVFSNIIYQLCTRASPADMHPLASLTVTYLVGSISAGVLYFVCEKAPDLGREYSHLNAAPFILGVAIVGLEAGFIYAYKAGWQVSRLSIVQSSFLSCALLVIGALVYHEQLNFNKLFGAAVCLVGLYFINKN